MISVWAEYNGKAVETCTICGDAARAAHAVVSDDGEVLSLSSLCEDDCSELIEQLLELEVEVRKDPAFIYTEQQKAALRVLRDTFSVPVRWTDGFGKNLVRLR